MLLIRNLKVHVPLLSSVIRLIQPVVRCYNEIPFEEIPDVSSATIKKTLKTQNIAFDEGYTCLIISCPVCQKSSKASLKNVYINKTTGMFMCSSCKQTGQWDHLEKKISVKKKYTKTMDNDDVMVAHNNLLKLIEQIQNDTRPLKVLSENEICDILKKFKLPAISKNAFENFDIRIDSNKHNLYFSLENVESEIVGYRKFDIKTNFDTTVPSMNYGGLVTAKPLKNKDVAVLVPNISDLLVLLDAKISNSIVCLPNGVNNLSQYVLPTLERYKKLVMWFGNDLKSWDSARHFAKKLGEKRCLFVRPTEKHLLPHLVDKEDFKTIISSAQPIWHKSITTFASLRQDVLSDLQNIDKAVEHATYVHDIAHVIIDNLQFMMGTTEDQKHMDRFWKQDTIIAAFRTFATRKNCHVSLVIHPRKERDDEDLTTSSIFGGAKASQEADNILIIQDKRLAALKGKKYLQVAKNRYSGDLGVMALDFDKQSLSFAPKKKKIPATAVKETTEPTASTTI